MKKILIISAFSLLLSGCYQAKTHVKFLTEHREAWINGFASKKDEHKEADKGLLFCMANVDSEMGVARPTCYKPEYKSPK